LLDDEQTANSPVETGNTNYGNPDLGNLTDTEVPLNTDLDVTMPYPPPSPPRGRGQREKRPSR